MKLGMSTHGRFSASDILPSVVGIASADFCDGGAVCLGARTQAVLIIVIAPSL